MDHTSVRAPERKSTPLRILLGPWDKSLDWIGQVAGADIIAFGRDTPLPYRFYMDSIQDLLGRLPDGWVPNALLFWQPQMRPLPDGWERSGIPSFAVLEDWQTLGALDGRLDWLRAFDGVFLDRPGVEFLRSQGFDRAWPSLTTSFDPSLFLGDPATRRDYDISFAGRLTHPSDRVPNAWLYRAATLADRYRVAFYDWQANPQQYAGVLKQTRIAFGHSSHGELNLRCFEAMAAGAALFLEEGNLDAAEHFQDGIHYVSYNESNYAQRLAYYLAHDEEREKIAREGWLAVRQHTYAAHLQAMAARIATSLREPRRSTRQAWTRHQAGINTFLDVATPMTRLRREAIGRAWEAHEPGNEDGWRNVALAVADLRLAATMPPEEQQAVVERAVQGLQAAITEHPERAWPHACLGGLWMMVNQPMLALASFGRAIELLEAHPAAAVASVGPFLPPVYDHFTVAWLETNLRGYGSKEARGRAWRELLEARCHEFVGRILLEHSDAAWAQREFARAVELRPDIGALHLLFAQAAAKAGHVDQALMAVREANRIDAINPDAWRLEAGLLTQTGQYQACIETCRERLVALRGLSTLEPLHRKSFEELLAEAERAAQDGGKRSTKAGEATAAYPRPEVLALIPTTATRILEVGCQDGALGDALKRRQPCEVVGIACVPMVVAPVPGTLDRVYTGDMAEVAPELPDAAFDCIVLAGILEHLADPAAVLSMLAPKLAPEGLLVVSVPIARRRTLLMDLLENRGFAETGHLARTGERFFTRASFEQMLAEGGYRPYLAGATLLPAVSVPAAGNGMPPPVIEALRAEGFDVAPLAQEWDCAEFLYDARLIACASDVCGDCDELTEDEGLAYDERHAMQEVVERTCQAGQAALDAGDLAQAAEHFAAAVQVAPDLDEAQQALGVILMALGRFEEALPHLEVAAGADAERLNQLGVAYYQCGQLDGAEGAFQRAREAEPAHVQAGLNLVDLYRAQSRYVEATQVMKGVLAGNLEDPDVVFAFGALSLEVGDAGAAQVALRRLRATAPDHSGVGALLEGLAEFTASAS